MFLGFHDFLLKDFGVNNLQKVKKWFLVILNYREDKI